jgi:predicted DNA-binding transcriptional regulator YafY
MATMAALREAVEARSTVWISYLDNHGSTVERVVDPVRVEAGWLTAFDHRADDVRTFAVHRISSVHSASDG